MKKDGAELRPRQKLSGRGSSPAPPRRAFTQNNSISSREPPLPSAPPVKESNPVPPRTEKAGSDDPNCWRIPPGEAGWAT